jgi:phage repressor protein C with HTH and peptisase S24 domain
MLTHEEIWAGIDRLAQGCGYSASGLARRAGLDPTSFNRSKRFGPDGKPRWPSTESLAKILAVTGATMTEFVALLATENSPKSRSKAAPPPRKNIPMTSWANLAKHTGFDPHGQPTGKGWEDYEIDTQTPTSGVFAVRADSQSHKPFWRAGDVMIVDRAASVRAGMRVLVRLKTREILIKEMVKTTSSRIILRALTTDAEDRVFAPSDIDWMARITRICL